MHWQLKQHFQWEFSNTLFLTWMTNISDKQIEIALFFRFYIQSDLDLNCFTWKCIHSSSTKNFFVLMFQMFIFTSFTFAKIYFAKSHHVDLSFIVSRCSWDFCYAVEILVNIFFVLVI